MINTQSASLAPIPSTSPAFSKRTAATPLPVSTVPAIIAEHYNIRISSSTSVTRAR